MDIHILDLGLKGKTATAVFHIPVPDLNNSAGVPYRVAIVEQKGGSDNIKSELVAVGASELANLKSGAVVEVKKTVRFTSTNLSNAKQMVEIKAKYVKVSASIIADKKTELKHWGYKTNV